MKRLFSLVLAIVCVGLFSADAYAQRQGRGGHGGRGGSGGQGGYYGHRGGGQGGGYSGGQRQPMPQRMQRGQNGRRSGGDQWNWQGQQSRRQQQRQPDYWPQQQQRRPDCQSRQQQQRRPDYNQSSRRPPQMEYLRQMQDYRNHRRDRQDHGKKRFCKKRPFCNDNGCFEERSYIEAPYDARLSEEYLDSLPVVHREVVRTGNKKVVSSSSVSRKSVKGASIKRAEPEGCKNCPPTIQHFHITGNNNGGQGGQAVINNGSPGANVTNGPEVTSNNGPKPKPRQEGPRPAASINSTPPVTTAPSQASAGTVKTPDPPPGATQTPPPVTMPIGT